MRCFYHFRVLYFSLGENVILLKKQNLGKGQTMKAEYILTNGKFYTGNSSAPWADTAVVADGKFKYVGAAADAAEYQGETVDLGGRLVLPGLTDAHAHIGLSVMMGDDDDMPMYNCKSKEEVLEKLRAMVKAKPFSLYYVMFFGQAEALGPEGLHKSEIDKIVKHRPVILMEEECHSAWLNSGALKFLKVNENTPDLAPGYSYYERDEEGKLTGCIKEMTMLPILSMTGKIPEAKMKEGILKIVDFLSGRGVTSVFDAGCFMDEEKIYRIMKKIDEEGLLPLRLEATHIINVPSLVDGAVAEFKRLKALYETENIKFKTMKMMLDGTLRIHTAKQCTPYADADTTGGTLIPEERLYQFIKELDEEAIDFHVHTVGEGAVKMVMDCTERLIKEKGSKQIHITVAHVETLRDEDVARFKELDITADFTPHWFGGIDYTGVEAMTRLLGEKRALNCQRAKTVVDAGGRVTFSSDEVSMHSLDRWSPFTGMEIGHTRQEIRDGKDAIVYPPAEERLPLEALVKGYTSASAEVLRLDHETGTIEAGKDADLVVLDENLFDMDKYQIHNIVPAAVMFKGRLVSKAGKRL